MSGTAGEFFGAGAVRSTGMSERNPFDELDELFDRMQTNVERAARMWDPESFGTELPGAPSMRIDLEDRGDELVVNGDLPGFDPADIDVRLEERTLHVAATRDDTEEETDGEFVRRERHRRSVERSIPLPTAVDASAVTADYNNGVLSVRMPKADPDSDGTRIDVS